MTIIDATGALSILSSSVSGGSLLGGSSIQDTIYNKITQQYKDKIEKASEARKDVYDSRSKYYQEQSEKLSLIAGGVKNAADTIGTAVDGAKKIKDLLFDMKVFLESASKDSAYYAQEFDKKLTDINSAILESSGIYNLLGAKSRTNYEANDYDLEVNDKGSATTIQGYNVSADYMITDTDGKYWVPDMYNGIKRYDNYDSNTANIDTTYATSQSSSAGGGSSSTKVIDRTDTDYSSSTISFDVGGVSYTGTLSKGGSDIAQSWVYGGFNDAAGIAQAQSDVTSALDNIDLVIAQLSAQQATTMGAYNTLDNSVTQNQTEMNNALIAQMTEEYDFAAKMKMEYESVLTSISSISDTQHQYSQLFGSLLGDNKLMGYMFNQTV